jgi:hypothetical protein
MRCRRWEHLEVSLSNFTLLFQLIQHSRIYRSTTGMVGSADGRTVDVAGKGTGAAGNEGNTEDIGGWTDTVQIEREGEGIGR